MQYKSPEEVREVFAAEGYGEVADEIVAKARNAVAIVRSLSEDDEIPVGGSKLGGWPDVPEGFEWPRHEERPLAFFGQFALAEVPRAEGEPALPASGLLSVFYDFTGQPWGFDPKDRGAAVVMYWPETKGLVRMEPPRGAYDDMNEEYDEPFKACAVRYEVVKTYPDVGNEVYDREDAGTLLELYWQTVKAGQGDEACPRHQLLGHPLILQNTMELECQLASNGISCGGLELSPEEEARAKELEAGAGDWTLLLQLDTDETAQWTWGDSGMFYVWMRRQDLEARDFSKAWFVVQCA